MAIDVSSGALQERVVSSHTAFSCLVRLATQNGLNGAVDRQRVVESDELPVSRLIELASDFGLRAEPAQLDWQGLQTSGFTRSILALLKNTNVVVLTGSGRSGANEVAVWDPLHHHGDILFVPREDFQRAWGGDALIITPQPSPASEAPSDGFSRSTPAGLDFFGQTSAGWEETDTLGQPSDEISTHSEVAPVQIAAALPDWAITPEACGELPPAPPDIEKQQLAPGPVHVAPPPSPTSTRYRKTRPPSRIIRLCLALVGIVAFASIGVLRLCYSATGVIAAANTPRIEVSVTSPESTSSIRTAMRPSTASLEEAAMPAGREPAIGSAANTPVPDTKPTVVTLTSQTRPGEVAAAAATTTPVATIPVPALAQAAPPDGWEPAATAAAVEPPLAIAPNVETDAAIVPPVAYRFSPVERAALIERGDAFLSIGDVFTARLFYERAADLGDGQAAVRLGETFDPLFLAHLGVRGGFGDLGSALAWYRRASYLGVSEAETLVKSLEAK
jgi:hypothetical protein